MNIEEGPVTAIKVTDISKNFRIYKDKSHTLKDRVLFHKRNKFDVNHVLDHVSFTVNRGEALGLIGHNGCGKSTTLKLLNKILYPDSGTIEMKGRVSSLIELGAGFHPDMTGRENIYINASIFGLKKREIDDRLEDIIRFSELEDYIDSPVRTYSSGMYMRLAFAIAINVDADILLVDEILAVGDANFQKKCFDKLDSIKKCGTAIVIVSHSMDQIRSICDDVIWLDGGKIKEHGEAKTVCFDYLDAMNEKAAERHAYEIKETHKEDQDPAIKYPVQQVSSQVAKSATRMGSMFVRYTNISLQNDKGKFTNQFSKNDRIVIKMAVYAEKTQKQMDIIIKLFNKYGGHCFTLSRARDYGKYIDIQSGTSFSTTVSICNMNLVPGDYYLEFLVWDKDKCVRDELRHFIEFSIVPKNHSEYDNLGVVDPTRIWS